jgi:hypothetical protein
LQSQVNKAGKKRLSLSGLEILHGRLLWLYAREGNETYLRVVEPLRKITVRLPHEALITLSSILGVLLNGYVVLCRFLPLPMRSYMREVLAKFPNRVRRLTIYDQLNPAYAKYYTRDEAMSLLTNEGFVDVQFTADMDTVGR